MLWFPFKNRVNLSPFTKDYRGGEHNNEPINNFSNPPYGGKSMQREFTIANKAPAICSVVSQLYIRLP